MARRTTHRSTTGRKLYAMRVFCFSIPNESDISFLIYDINGSLIDEFHEAKQPPGYYQKTINLNNFPTGIYFLILKQNQYAVSRKLLIVR